MNIDSRGFFCILNPEIISMSDETFTMWDDCMSFPWLMVKVRRHKSISVKYQTSTGLSIIWDNVEQNISELLQHEIDHLNGILAVDLAMDNESIISRQLYLQNNEEFEKLVDYVIK